MHSTEIFTLGWWIFAGMIAVFLAAMILRRLPIGVALMIGAIAGGLFSGNGIPIRHLVEGSFTYFDPMLIIFTALLFMRVLEENGTLGALARLILDKLGGKPALLLAVVTVFIMFPAMLTGITTTSVLTTGALMAPVLMAMGMSQASTGTMIALVGMMGMFAPPINLIVMLIGQGVDMPYIGFEGPLAAASFPLALFTAFTLGYRKLKTADISAAIDKLPKLDDKTRGVAIYTPLFIVFMLMGLIRLDPQFVPDIGAPLIFIMGATAGLFTGRRFAPVPALYRSLITALPVLGLLAGIGMFLQVMTLTGVRGLLVVSVLSLPVTLTYLGLIISLPLFGGVSAFASAMVFGVPFLLSLLGRNEIVLCAGIALLAAMGDVIPPSAIEARFGAQIVGESNFLKITRRCIPFLILFGATGLAMIFWADSLSFLTP